MSNVLHSLNGLARQIGIPLERLRALAVNAEGHYRPFESKRPGKKARLIDNPSEELKRVQRHIRQNILASHPLDASVRACVKGGSPLKHATAVANQMNVAETDLKNCYPKITNKMVFRCLLQLGYGPRPASLLTRLMTRGGHVPQGAPTSDLVANQVLTPLDEVANKIARERGLTYGRCMDGFVVAGRDTREALELIIKAILASGLAVRRSKTRNAGARRAQEVAGYTVNGKPGPKVRKAKRQAIRTAVQQLVLAHRRGEDITLRLPVIRGFLAYLKPTNPGAARRLLRQMESAGIAVAHRKAR
jgi:RNA-directed DNA polymerase